MPYTFFMMNYNMDGYKAFKYYLALKLHFHNVKYDVFANNGRIRCSRDAFFARKDHKLFEKLARQFDDKELIKYIVANMMYGNEDVVYNLSDGMSNYKEFLRRKQSITRIFQNDLETIIGSKFSYDFTGLSVPGIIQLYLARKITLETVVILDSLDNFVSKIRQHQSLSMLLESDLMTIEKARKFVKFDKDKINKLYTNFKGELEQINNGKDVSLPS